MEKNILRCCNYSFLKLNSFQQIILWLLQKKKKKKITYLKYLVLVLERSCLQRQSPRITNPKKTIQKILYFNVACINVTQDSQHYKRVMENFS
ncbi:hypothetical protein Pint_29761 [Pistacia integerrima]|uniref:Uncharacterized protein n=1 Tax=Pistacia integerrima TaxID=434235 RepID=A0ACC0X1B3_9ROSI|nr:hypothetical protein Pint_29761 [Pistacia integerrima]